MKNGEVLNWSGPFGNLSKLSTFLDSNDKYAELVFNEIYFISYFLDQFEIIVTKLIKNDKIHTIRLNDCVFTGQAVNMIKMLSEIPSLKMFYFENCGISDSAAEELTVSTLYNSFEHLLKFSQSLEGLFIINPREKIDANSAWSLVWLMDTINETKRLKNLSLVSIMEKEEIIFYWALCKLVKDDTCSITSLNVSGNFIKDEINPTKTINQDIRTDENLNGIIYCSSKLTFLDISNNFCEKKLIDKITGSFKTSETFRTLIVSANAFHNSQPEKTFKLLKKSSKNKKNISVTKMESDKITIKFNVHKSLPFFFSQFQYLCGINQKYSAVNSNNGFLIGLASLPRELLIYVAVLSGIDILQKHENYFNVIGESMCEIYEKNKCLFNTKEIDNNSEKEKERKNGGKHDGFGTHPPNIATRIIENSVIFMNKPLDKAAAPLSLPNKILRFIRK